ncbi:DNA repair-scaffolding protein [Lemmus lemmus]
MHPAVSTAPTVQGTASTLRYDQNRRQKLLIPNVSCPIILNTYFCQKAVAKETVHEEYCQDTSLPRRSITLAQVFRIEDITSGSSRKQIACSGLATTGTGWTHRHDKTEQHLVVGAPLRDSLLDIVESQRTDPWSGVRVQVVVQRVYSLLSRDGARSQQQHTEGHAESPGTWSCLLVQDACGMFGEVYLDGSLWKSTELEGRSCVMAGMKVLQKATRGRAPGLFSLIDTMWPPVMPLAEPSCGQPSEENGEHGTRCSFYAKVIYQRQQLKNLLAQKEIWLLVTDITLQIQDERDHSLPKTLPIYVAPSCVLGPGVLEELAMAVPPNILFRDALQDKGQIVCVERTVLLPQKSLLYVPPGAGSCDLPGPVTLDELGSFTPVNSICSVQGAVVGVDESTAFLWLVCDQCGNGRLEQKPEDGGLYSCGDCSRLVVSPLQKRCLHVFLDCPTRPKSTVKVKSYEVKNVLGKEMGPLLCFVQSITPQQTGFVTLEEIELLDAGGANHPPS